MVEGIFVSGLIGIEEMDSIGEAKGVGHMVAMVLFCGQNPDYAEVWRMELEWATSIRACTIVTYRSDRFEHDDLREIEDVRLFSWSMFNFCNIMVGSKLETFILETRLADEI